MPETLNAADPHNLMPSFVAPAPPRGISGKPPLLRRRSHTMSCRGPAVAEPPHPRTGHRPLSAQSDQRGLPASFRPEINHPDVVVRRSAEERCAALTRPTQLL